MTPTPKQRTSEVLQEIIDRQGEEKISLGEFTGLLGDRAFALVILIFALPNSLPIPGIPGFSTITGLPIIFIAIQMIMMRKTIWLPRKIAQKQFSQSSMKKVLKKAMPAVIWLERYLRPRMVWMVGCRAEPILGALFLILALVISLPIPGGNFLPGLSMSLIALGMLERDGLFVLSAIGFATVSVMLMYKIIALFIKTSLRALGF